MWICTTVRGAPRAVYRARSQSSPPRAKPIEIPARIAFEPEPIADLDAPELDSDAELAALIAALAPVAEVAPIAVPEPIVEVAPIAELAPIAAGAPIVAPITETVSIAEPEPTAEPDGFAELVRALVGVALERGATRSAALIPDLLARGVLRGEALAEKVHDRLARAGVIDSSSAGTPSSGFLRTADTWRAVLQNENADLSECGSSTLDCWAAELLAALLDTDRVDELRKELRRRGVAAFGMIAQAA